MSLNRLVLPANLEGRGYHCRGGGSIFLPVVVSTSAESKATGLRVNEYCANIPINQLFAKAEVPPSAFQPLDKVLYMKEEMYFAGLITQAADKGRFQVVKMTGREDRQAIPLKHVAPLVEPPTTESPCAKEPGFCTNADSTNLFLLRSPNVSTTTNSTSVNCIKTFRLLASQRQSPTWLH